MYSLFIKRLIDFLLALLLIVTLSPLILIVVVLLTIANGGKPFFFQKRPGRHGKIFTIAKMKTMNDKKDEHGKLLPDADRLTTIGSVVRKTSLDELPQLFNVLLGQMSFVGPRPLLVEYLPLYNEEQGRRHHVRPGITGWAQVNGRNALSWEEKFAHDVWYVDRLSFALDMKILFLTVMKVIRPQGISAEGSATMEKFTGTKP